jgi:3-dehydroquinate dehydratase-2
MNRVLVLNGPNLGRLGTREPEIYGTASLADLTQQLSEDAPDWEIDVRQSDSEPALMGWLHEATDSKTPVIINPAAFTNYSYALRDAVAMLSSAGGRKRCNICLVIWDKCWAETSILRKDSIVGCSRVWLR